MPKPSSQKQKQQKRSRPTAYEQSFPSSSKAVVPEPTSLDEDGSEGSDADALDGPLDDDDSQDEDEYDEEGEPELVDSEEDEFEEDRQRPRVAVWQDDEEEEEGFGSNDSAEEESEEEDERPPALHKGKGRAKLVSICSLLLSSAHHSSFQRFSLNPRMVSLLRGLTEPGIDA